MPRPSKAILTDSGGALRGGSLVEMVAALEAKKPAALLVGAAAKGDELRFEPNTKMLTPLFNLMDVAQAEATVPEDKVRPSTCPP